MTWEGHVFVSRLCHWVSWASWAYRRASWTALRFFGVLFRGLARLFGSFLTGFGICCLPIAIFEGSVVAGEIITYALLVPGVLLIVVSHSEFYEDSEPPLRPIFPVGSPVASAVARVESLPPDLSKVTPPINAEFLFFLFLPPRDCDALTGDLEERFRLIFAKFGKRKADFWYWIQCLTSISPIVWAWLKRVAVKPVVWLVALLTGKDMLTDPSWLAGLMELWKRMRS